jgi:hypothetical protein
MATIWNAAPRAWRIATLLAALAAVLVLSLSVPIPSLPDGGETSVRRVVHERLPGWTVERVNRSWEGAYTVVTVCAGRVLGFQYVPGHGLPERNAWLRPNDTYARERLASTSDDWRDLVWYDDPAIVDSLSCRDELFGQDQVARDTSRHD